MNRRIRMSHPSEGDLIRYLDEELYELDERRIQVHVRGCASCRARLDALAAATHSAARAIGGMEVAGPSDVVRARALAAARRANAERSTRRAGGTGRQAVAAAIALVVIGASVSPVRAWVSTLLPSAPTPVAAPALVTLPAAPAAHRSSVVAFRPSGALFELHVDAPQAEGTLTVEVRSGARGTAQIVGGDDETMLVLPSGLHVENSPGSTGSYHVTVPAEVPAVRVIVGGEHVHTLRPSEEPAGSARVFSLSGAEAGR